MSCNVIDEDNLCKKYIKKWDKQYDGQVWEYYKPEQWVPHSTLCMNLSKEMFKKSTELYKILNFQ